MRADCRDLLDDDERALAMACDAGAHGVYVRNAMAAGEGEGFVLSVADRDHALVWVGPRGNLVVITTEVGAATLAPEIIRELLARRRPWRIAMGPASVVDGLREHLPHKPLICRDQVYYTGNRNSAAVSQVRDDVRSAERGDRDRLVQATLLLNASDLNVDPARVDRRWLRDTIDERIANGTTQVIGPVGGLHCKLDYGSRGPGGLVIEGVFTFPEVRGRGLASSLVAACLLSSRGDVCLHVGKHNSPARSAYEAAGMVESGACRLLLTP